MRTPFWYRILRNTVKIGNQGGPSADSPTEDLWVRGFHGQPVRVADTAAILQAHLQRYATHAPWRKLGGFDHGYSSAPCEAPTDRRARCDSRQPRDQQPSVQQQKREGCMMDGGAAAKRAKVAQKPRGTHPAPQKIMQRALPHSKSQFAAIAQRTVRPPPAEIPGFPLPDAPSPETGLYHCPLPDCTSKFKRRYDLSIHQRVHTDERPYACTLPGCTQRFKTVGSRTAHERTHSGKRPHVCPVTTCNASFAQQSSRTRHYRLMHKDVGELPPELHGEDDDDVDDASEETHEAECESDRS